MENQGLILSGTVRYQITRNPVPNALVLMASPDSISDLEYCFTDDEGRFHFLVDRFYDQKSIILQAFNMEGEEDFSPVISIDDKNGRSYSFPTEKIRISGKEQKYLEQVQKIRLINTIYASSDTTLKARKPNLKKPKKESFYGRPDHTIYPEEFIDLPDFASIARNIIPWVQFRKKGSKYELRLFTGETHYNTPPDKLIMLNGIPFDNLDHLATLGSKDIDRIEIINTPYYYGDLSYRGIVSIFTKDNKLPGSWLENNALVYKNKTVPFNSSTNPTETNDMNDFRIPDLRQNLYWNPNLKLKAGGKKQILFRTSDLKSDYTIKIQGITNRGIPIDISQEIHVE
jgi:hypothetical protein